MMRHKGYLVWILLAGACGALLRGMSLLFGYEGDTGLPVDGYLPALLLIGLTIGFPVLSALVCRRWFRDDAYAYEQLFGGARGLPLVLELAGALGIVLTAACGLYFLPSELVEEMSVFGEQIVAPGAAITGLTALSWLLAMLSGVCLILLTITGARRKPAGKRLGWFLIVPILWGCVDLIVVYHDNSANPVTSEYAYQLLLIITVMMAYRSMGAFLYSEGSETRFFAAAGMSVYLAMTNMGGMLIWLLRANSDLTMMEYFGVSASIRAAVYFAAGVYFLGQTANALRVKPLPQGAERQSNE